jgi:RNA polymerase sigma-70 factor (ECF subfamily)
LAAENPQTEWVRRAQGGDLQAFEQLFDQYQRGIYNVIFQMVRSEADAADLTQDVFVRAWKALPRLDAPEAFTSWLYRIATNLSRNWIRDNTRVRKESLDQPFGGDEEDGGTREIADYSADPAAVVQTQAVQDVVRGAIDGLSQDHRTVVTLHHMDGMAVEDIAKVMNCSVGTVKSRLSRARDHLKRKLAGFVER